VVVELKIETEREDDGRWIAEVTKMPGVMCYGESEQAAVAAAQALALRVFADQIDL
jgi:predicted RNase H-like HicB family nuclease